MKHVWKFLGVLVAGLFLIAGAGGVMAQTESPSEADWYARYWNNMEQEGPPSLEQNVRVVAYDWGTDSPAPGITSDNFSARWTSPVHFEEGTYRFVLTSDDGARVWLDDEYIINSWQHRPATTDVAIVDLEEGTHSVAVDYFEDGGQALVSFSWERIDDNDDTEVTINPLSGPVGTEIAVQASGFIPGNTVTVGIGRANSEPWTSFQAEIPASGVLETDITVPEDADVGEPWRVLVRSDVQQALSNDFTVTALGGEAGVCGPTYVVQPNDWLSTIARDCNTTVSSILAANPSITDPDVIRPGMTLNMPAAGEAAPQVTITPESGGPDMTIQASATGFEPNVEVSVALRRPDELPFTGKPVMTDAEGRLQTTIDLPESAQAGQTWHVLVRSDERSAESEAFTVTSGAQVTATPQYNLNLRSGPGTESADIGTVPAGTTVPVLERSPDNNWVRVRYDDAEGWIAAWLSNISGSLNEVPQSATG